MLYGFDTCCSLERMSLFKLSTTLSLLQRRALYGAELVGMAVDNELLFSWGVNLHLGYEPDVGSPLH